MIEKRETSNKFITDYFEQVNYFDHAVRKSLKQYFLYSFPIGNFWLLFKAKKWISLFTSLQGAGGICDGYSKENVTPYMHSMAYHVPGFMRMHGGIKKFTGQGELFQ